MGTNRTHTNGERKLREVTHFIKQWRKHRKITVEELAKQAGMSASMISQLERGRSAYTQDTLEAVAKALDLKPSALLDRDPDDNAGLSVSMGGREIIHEVDLKSHLGEELWALLQELLKQQVKGLVSTMRDASQTDESNGSTAS